MFCAALNGYSAAEGAAWIDQLLGRKGAATFFALVAKGIFIAAYGAGAYDIPVCKKDAFSLVEVLLTFALFKNTIII